MQLTTFVLASGYHFLLNMHSQAAILDSKLSRFSDQQNKHKLTDFNANILEKLWASMLLQSFCHNRSETEMQWCHGIFFYPYWDNWITEPDTKTDVSLENHTSLKFLPRLCYLVLNLSCPAQYSCQISLKRKRWKMRMRKPTENQKMVGSPPSLLPWRWSAMTWCSWAGAETLGVMRLSSKTVWIYLDPVANVIKLFVRRKCGRWNFPPTNFQVFQNCPNTCQRPEKSFWSHLATDLVVGRSGCLHYLVFNII